MRRTRCRPLTISMTAPGAVATPPSTSPAAPGITEDILASEEPGTKGNTTVIVQTVAGSTAARFRVPSRAIQRGHPVRDLAAVACENLHKTSPRKRQVLAHL